MSNDYAVFNPGAPVAATVTLSFTDPSDAAWFEAAVIELKKNGRHSPLMTGILRGALAKASNMETKGFNGRTITPEQLKQIRFGSFEHYQDHFVKPV